MRSTSASCSTLILVVAPSAVSPATSTHRWRISCSPARSPPGTTAAAGRPHTEHGLATGILARRCGATTPVVDFVSNHHPLTALQHDIAGIRACEAPVAGGVFVGS